jgi:hypothetical protein
MPLHLTTTHLKKNVQTFNLVILLLGQLLHKDPSQAMQEIKNHKIIKLPNLLSLLKLEVWMLRSTYESTYQIERKKN